MTNNSGHSTADTAPLLTGRLVFGDHGVGATPLDGDLNLTAAGNRTWQSKLSSNALEAAEQHWHRRRDAHTLTNDEAVAIAKIAFDVDLTFLGLSAVWETAVLTPIAGDAAIGVEATVRPTPPRTAFPRRRAAVRLDSSIVFPRTRSSCSPT
jgi:hypothetical protein